MFDRSPMPESDQLKDQLLKFFPIVETTHCLAYRTFIKEGITQSIIHAFKYQDMPRLGKVIGKQLATAWIGMRSQFDVVVPVPLHRTRLAERGFNQSEEIARGIGSEWGLPVFGEKAIRRVRPTRSQATLSVPERLENVQGAFRLSKAGHKLLQAKRVLLVDDVLTTGSTIASVANELLLAAPTSVNFLVFASAVIDN